MRRKSCDDQIVSRNIINIMLARESERIFNFLKPNH